MCLGGRRPVDCSPHNNRALVAQRIEHLTTDQKVGGSNPSERTFVISQEIGNSPNPSGFGLFRFSGLVVLGRVEGELAVSTTEFGRLIGASPTNVGGVLKELEKAGVLRPSRTNRQGPGFFYVSPAARS